MHMIRNLFVYLMLSLVPGLPFVSPVWAFDDTGVNIITRRPVDAKTTDSGINLKLTASPTTLGTGQSATLTAEFSGDIKSCTDPRCTGTVLGYVNDIAVTADDTALALSLKKVTNSFNMLSRQQVYVATYDITAREPGTHSVSIRVNGSNKGSFKIAKKDFDVFFQDDCTQVINEKSGEVTMDCNGTDQGTNPPPTCTPSEEICDGVDNDCDGEIDEGVKNTYHLDLDGDGFGTGDKDVQGCVPPQKSPYVEESGDCNDQDVSINPGVPEICADSIDNNCDGQTDEGCTPPPADCTPTVYHLDLDGDGYGGTLKDVTACVPPSDLYVTDGSDCNDNNHTINPGAVEICNDGIDNDCDGELDENCITPPEDKDGDGYTVDEDCDDNNAAVHPGAEEVCDGLDNDCNGLVDDHESCVILPNINESPTVGPIVPVGPALPTSSTAPQPSQSNPLSGGYMLGGSSCQLDRNATLATQSNTLLIFGVSLFALLTLARVSRAKTSKS